MALTARETGRLKALVALTLFVLTSATVIGIYLSTRGAERLHLQAPRFVLTCVMAHFIYRGSRWAYRVTIALLGVAVALLGVAPLANLVTMKAEMLVLASVYGSVIGLLLQTDTRLFLASQRTRQP